MTLFGKTQDDSLTTHNILNIADTARIGKVERVTFKGIPGVFLTNDQEVITLAKIILKDKYKLKAQVDSTRASNYFINFVQEREQREKLEKELKITRNNLETANSLKLNAEDRERKETNKRKEAEAETDVMTEKRNKWRTVAIIEAVIVTILTITK
jgi:hypothetical protein